MKSSLEAYHQRRRENFARGLEFLVHSQIDLGSRVSGGLWYEWLLNCYARLFYVAFYFGSNMVMYIAYVHAKHFP